MIRRVACLLAFVLAFQTPAITGHLAFAQAVLRAGGGATAAPGAAGVAAANLSPAPVSAGASFIGAGAPALAPVQPAPSLTPSGPAALGQAPLAAGLALPAATAAAPQSALPPPATRPGALALGRGPEPAASSARPIAAGARSRPTPASAAAGQPASASTLRGVAFRQLGDWLGWTRGAAASLVPVEAGREAEPGLTGALERSLNEAAMEAAPSPMPAPAAHTFQRRSRSWLLEKLALWASEYQRYWVPGLVAAGLVAAHALLPAAVWPLVLLLGPCTYDYWCIHDKIRSAAAVDEIRTLMQEWTTVLLQIAEDVGAESEGNAFETEHAMKNAVEDLVDDLMDDESFRALSQDEQVRVFQERYKEFAIRYLKDKAFSEDDEGTIRKILADARNQPFYDRLAAWLRNHQIFEKWRNPHEKKKVKEGLQEKGNDKTRSMGGWIAAPLAMAAFGFGLPDLSSLLGPALAAVAGMVFMVGQLAPEGGEAADATLPDGARAKVRGEGRREGREHDVRVVFNQGVTAAQGGAILSELGLGSVPGDARPMRTRYHFVLHPADRETAEGAARRLAAHPLVSEVAAPQEVADRLGVRPASEAPAAPAAAAPAPAPEAAAPAAPETNPPATAAPQADATGAPSAEAEPAPASPADKRLADPSLGPSELRVSFHPNVPWSEARQVLERHGLPAEGDGSDVQERGWTVNAVVSSPELAAAKATALSLEATVRAVWLKPPPVTVPEEAAPAPQSPAAPAEGVVVPVEAPVEAAEAASAAAEPAKPQRPAPRDVQRAFVDWLGQRKLLDGQPLKPKQAELLLRFLRPVQYKPEAPSLPVIARTQEIQKSLPILLSPRGMRNSVVFVGEAGVGKTAIVEGIAQLIEEAENATGEAGSYLDLKRLKGRWFLEFNIDEMLSPGADEDPIALFKEVVKLVGLLNDPAAERGNELVLLFDEIHKLFQDPNGRKIANFLKGPLRDGRLSVAATVTSAEYKEYIEKDDAFRRRLEKVEVKEPTVEQAIEMLRGLKPVLEARHSTRIPDESVVAAAKLSHQFDKTNFLPDKGIKLLQDSAELARPDNLRAHLALQLRETWRKLALAAHEAKELLSGKGIASTIALPIEAYNKIAELAGDAVRFYRELGEVADGRSVTSLDLLKRVLAEKTGIASGQLTLAEDDASRYIHMEDEVGKRVINQERALKALANAIRRNKAGISNPNRPMGKFLMVGPTGVGKTHVAKELARFLFKDPNAMIRFDMSEFMEEHTWMRLTGAPPSFVGYGEGGQLTEQVRQKPYSVILLDEIEKAHPKVLNVLLQILDDGRLTDGQGRTVDFKNTVILFTSNVGMAAVDYARYQRLLADETDPAKIAAIEARWDAEIDAAVEEGIRSHFRPELLNRLDQNPDSKKQWITFNRLSRANVQKIAEIQVGEFKELLAERHGVHLDIQPEVFDLLGRAGFDPAFGARPMTGAIEKLIIDPLARWILERRLKGEAAKDGEEVIRIGVNGAETTFEALTREKPVPARASLAGVAERLAGQVLSRVESALESGGELPDGAELDRLFRALGPEAGARPQASAPADAKPKPRFALAADTPLELPENASTKAASHNNPGKKDESAREAQKAIADALAADSWPKEVSEALEGAGASEGWLKTFVRQAKQKANDSMVTEPIALHWEVTPDALRVLVHRGHEMGPIEKNTIAAHFTGEPPASLQDAQAKADRLALGSTMVWNYIWLDLYRRVVALPGARLGFVSGEQARGGRGTDYWIEIPRPRPADADQAPAGDPRLGQLTLHQRQEWEKAKRLFLAMAGNKQDDGHSALVAATNGYSLLALAEDAPRARDWIRDRKWLESEVSGAKLREEWPLVMLAANVLERFGNPLDIPAVEALMHKYGEATSHYDIPGRQALASALAALYARAGRQEARRAMAREIGHADIKEALKLALAQNGTAEDLEALKDAPLAWARLAQRAAPAAYQAWKAERWPPKRKDDGSIDKTAWGRINNTERMAVLERVGADPAAGEADLDALTRLVAERGEAIRVTMYVAAKAWADVAVRLGRTQGLEDQLKRFLDTHSLGDYNNSDDWGVLLALLYALEEAGSPAALGDLNALLKHSGTVQAAYEQPRFRVPVVWGRIVARHGLLKALSRPSLENGQAKAPRIPEMLQSHKAAESAAAMTAMAHARRDSGVGAPPARQATGPAPDLVGRIKPGESSGGYGAFGPYGHYH